MLHYIVVSKISFLFIFAGYDENYQQQLFLFLFQERSGNGTVILLYTILFEKSRISGTFFLTKT